LAKGEKTDKPKEPKGFTIDHLKMSEGTADVFLSWYFDAENVLFYEIYHAGERNRELVGRIYDEVYYIHQLKNRDHERKTYLELLAVSPDHSRSTALCKDITWSVN
jgi:UDP-N-acetylmuramate-alanine ligase